MRKVRGFHIVECAIALFVLTGMVLSTLSTIDVMRKSFVLSDRISDAMNQTRCEALTVLPLGNWMIRNVNSEKLKSTTAAAAASVAELPTMWQLPFFIEVKAYAVSVVPSSGDWSGMQTVPGTTTTLGTLALSPSVDKRSDLDAQVRALEADVRKKGVQDLFSAPLGASMDGQPKRSGTLVLLAARSVIDLGKGTTGKLWEKLTGDSYLVATKVSILRGDMA